MTGPLYESMIPQDRRATVAVLVRAATTSCLARKTFYGYAAIHGLAGACDYLEIQRGVDAAAARMLRTEIEEIIAELTLPPPTTQEGEP